MARWLQEIMWKGRAHWICPRKPKVQDGKKETGGKASTSESGHAVEAAMSGVCFRAPGRSLRYYPMGYYPGLLPGYNPLHEGGRFREGYYPMDRGQGISQRHLLLSISLHGH
jgi:hypothetical protein